MTDAPAAFQATIHGFKTLPSRKVVSITIECPIEMQAEIARICEHGAWVAVARLQGASTKGGELSSPPNPSLGSPAPREESRAPNSNPEAQRAAMIGGEPEFWRFVTEVHHPYRVNNKDDAKKFIRYYCRVPSRADIKGNPQATRRLDDLERHYRNWQARA